MKDTPERGIDNSGAADQDLAPPLVLSELLAAIQPISRRPTDRIAQVELKVAASRWGKLASKDDKPTTRTSRNHAGLSRGRCQVSGVRCQSRGCYGSGR